MGKLAIIALKYLESDYEQTLACLRKVECPVFYADRDGVGNMSRAFNEAFIKHVQGKFEYVWFVTNIVFEPDVPGKLLKAIEDCELIGGIHPAMDTSDHKHLWPDGSGLVKSVPFIEFTAPMYRSELIEQFAICESTPYYYMDLILSHQVRQYGLDVCVHTGTAISHTYLRNKRSKHPISLIREKLRHYHTPLSKQYMIDNYGPNWQEKLWPKNLIDMNSKINGADHEVSFWQQFIKTDRFLKGWVKKVKTPELNDIVADFIRDKLPINGSMLDCGSGVVSILNGLMPDNYSLVASDILGDEYAKIFNYADHGLVQPLPVGAEDLSFVDQFDIVHMSNALDHTQNPNKAWERLLQAAKLGGYVIVQGFENEADHENWKGMHQWNIRLNDKILEIDDKQGRFAELNNPVFSQSFPLPNKKTWFIWICQK